MDFTLFEARPGLSIALLPDAPKFTIVAVSNDYVTDTGVQRDGVIGKGYFEAFSEHSEDRGFTLDQSVKQSFEYVLKNKKPHRFVQSNDVRGSDESFAERHWRITNVPVLDNEGDVTYIIYTTERTQELENQKSLFDDILKNSSNGITVTEMIRDENGKVIDAKTILVNNAAVQNTGLPKDVYLSTTAVQLDPTILSSPYGRACLKTLETGEPSLMQYKLEATGRWLDLTISKMDDEHLIHIFTDVTPIKEAHLQLEKTIEELKRSNSNLEEFAYAASHDLKEPIRKIRTFSDRLKFNFEGRLLEEDQHYFTRMEKATARMQQLIDDLLEYSHVSAAIESLDAVDLNKKVDQVLEDLEIEIAAKNARITVGSLPVIKGSAGR